MRVPPARWETIQQFIRIAIFSIAGWLFGSDWTEEPMIAEAVAGAVAIANLIWWMVWETKRPANVPDHPDHEPAPEPEEGTTTVTTTTTKDPAPPEAPTPKPKKEKSK